MKVKVLYVTFARDYEFLRYSLQSFRKYCSGFAGVTIVVPANDLSQFLPFEKEFSTPDCPVWIKNFLEYPGKGFVHHLAMKCYADALCPDADLVLHLDPDCLWIKPTRPENYFVDGKPVLLVEPFEAILRDGHDGRYGWKRVTEAALRFECPYETMCRHPAVHYRRLYRDVRDRIESIHQVPFIDYVLKQKNEFPQGFCEYVTLGSYVTQSDWKRNTT